jgi:mono/diheme cytochrome c family protein
MFREYRRWRSTRLGLSWEAMRVFSGISGSVVRWFAFTTPVLLALVISGCDPEGYPAELKYPTRTDAIVVKPSDEEVYRPEPPGHLDIDLEKYKELRKQNKGEAYDPTALSGTARAAITESLEKHFGTPAKPFVKVTVADDAEAFQAALDDLQLKDADLEQGSKLYRRHCLHCHGVSGNGRGPTGPWLNPHPRDYRKGVFKFTSSGTTTPSRDDLYRTLKNGIDYTSMPSFGLLPDQELDRLVSYVIHLALRGKAEEETMIAVLKKEVEDKKSAIEASVIEEVGKAVLTPKIGWAAANKASSMTPLTTPPTDLKPDDLEIGYRLFLGDGGCIACHKDFGRQSLFRFDSWGTLVQPRDLTEGHYRAGRRPIDFYWRIKGGIKPSTMNAVTDVLLTPDENKKITALKDQLGKETDGQKKQALQADIDKKTAEWSDANIWRIVAFVRAAPFPRMLPERVRNEVYPVSLAKKDE